MTKEERAMLREAAEKAAKAPATQFACLPHKAIANFGRTANPATILSLLDALDGAERDAERYRWLKSQAYKDDEFDSGSIHWNLPREELIAGVWNEKYDRTLDQAIDAAIKKESHD